MERGVSVSGAFTQKLFDTASRGAARPARRPPRAPPAPRTLIISELATAVHGLQHENGPDRSVLYCNLNEYSRKVIVSAVGFCLVSEGFGDSFSSPLPHSASSAHSPFHQISGSYSIGTDALLWSALRRRRVCRQLAQRLAPHVRSFIKIGLIGISNLAKAVVLEYFLRLITSKRFAFKGTQVKVFALCVREHINSSAPSSLSLHCSNDREHLALGHQRWAIAVDLISKYL
ncbi:hypothetical protein EVAR_97516_1 [Eumeta japonica]|uniref:Uncharacterized protein n=1 Tax=Eumeta variegata TaxID=151549 RepID=A0A4C1WKR6_EUMVA|nr:hypothetical protein EVAR_97516_1 [Eumeta japonica]